MSPAHVFEPTFQAIRNRLLTGAWPMGFRLEAGRLADELGVSITPVRDSLNRLVGERLVELMPGIGFHVPQMTERRFRDLLDLHLALLLRALVEIGAPGDALASTVLSAEDHAARTAAIFSRIAARSENEEIVMSVQSVGTRLNAARLAETIVLSGAELDLDALEDALALEKGRSELGRELRHYHAIRQREASRLVAMLQLGIGS